MSRHTQRALTALAMVAAAIAAYLIAPPVTRLIGTVTARLARAATPQLGPLGAGLLVTATAVLATLAICTVITVIIDRHDRRRDK